MTLGYVLMPVTAQGCDTVGGMLALPLSIL